MMPARFAPTSMLHSSRSWLLVALLTATGCARCGKSPGGEAGSSALLELLPRDAAAVVVIPDAGALGEKLARFQGLKLASFVAQLQGFASGEAYASAVMRQVGVDLRSRTAMEKAGIDPARGVGIVMLPGGTGGYAVVGVKDRGTLEATLAGLAKSRLGAPVRAERTEGAGSLVTFSRTAGAEPQLGLLFTRGYVLVGAREAIRSLPSYAALPRERSLTQAPIHAASLSRLAGPRDFYAYLPGGGGALPQGTVEGLTLAGHISPEAVTLRADAPWPGARAAIAALQKQTPVNLLGYLASDTFLTVSFSGDPAALEGAWPTLVGPQVTRAVQSSGFDFNGEILQNLRSGLVMGVALAPTVQLAAGMPELDLRRTNPFRYVHFAAVGETRDAARAAATLERIPALASRFGARVTPEQRGTQRVFLTQYRQGEGAHLAVVGSRVLVAAPLPRLEQMLASLAAPPGPGPLAADLSPVLGGHTLAAVLDLRRLADAVKALPPQAWGVGGFAIKATTVRWLEATDDLRAVTFGLRAEGQALQAELSLRLAPQAARTP